MVERGHGWLQPGARRALGPLFRFLWDVHAEGLENIPTDGPAVLCPNHTSVLDSFFIPYVLPRPVLLLGKSEYLDDWKTRRLFPALGMVPIDRGGGTASQAALDAAARSLDAGGLLAVYPEGTRSRDGLLHKGHTGAARLALRTGAPLVPVGVRGSVEVQPPDARRPRPFLPVSIRFGRPIAVGRHRQTGRERLVLRQLTDELMFEIRELTGQRYIDRYATRRAEQLPAEVADLSTLRRSQPPPADVEGPLPDAAVG
ncbi:MAG: lysophospholipid acyltransferase family protein [Acidimicrobiia bacterium]